jgi:predicted MFS family arabinose efflux permease
VATKISMASVGGLGVLMIATFVAITTEILPVGLLPQMSDSFRVSESTVGLVVTLYAVVVAILALPLTAITARLPRKALLLSSIGGYGLSSAIVAIAPNFAVLCVGRAIGGVAHALFFSVVAAYASRLVPRELVGRAIAIAFAGTSLGYVLGVPLATSIGAAIGWRAGFMALAAAALILVLITGTLLPPIRNDHGHSSDHIRWRGTGIIGVGCANLLVFVSEYTAYTYIAPILVRSGIPTSAIGACLLLFGAAGIVGLWSASRFVDHRPRAGAIATFIVLSIGLAAAAFVSGTPVLILIAATVWSAAFGAAPSYLMTAAIRTESGSPDSAGAIVNGSSNLGIAAGAALGSLLIVTTGSIGTLVIASAIAVSAVILVALARRGFPSSPTGSQRN